jgi:dCTP diphosphatase
MLTRVGGNETHSGRAASDLVALRDRMRVFTAERDWSGFHDPKSVLLALVGEVGELAELFQWLPAADAANLGKSGPLHTRAAEEISDVLLYLVLLADTLDIDLAAAANAKLTDAAVRYPAGAPPTGPGPDPDPGEPG